MRMCAVDIPDLLEPVFPETHLIDIRSCQNGNKWFVLCHLLKHSGIDPFPISIHQVIAICIEKTKWKLLARVCEIDVTRAKKDLKNNQV